MDVAVDESIRYIGPVKLHQFRLFQVIEEKLHLALVKNLRRVSLGTVSLQTLRNPTFVGIKTEHVVEKLVNGTPDEREMRIHARQADRAIGKERHNTGGIAKHSHVAVLHDVGAFGTLGPDQFSDKPPFQNESLELFLEAGDMTVGRPELRELWRGEFGHGQLADTEACDGRILDSGFRDQKDFGFRVENPHMLDGMAQITGDGPIMVKEKCEIVVQKKTSRRPNYR